MTRCAEGIPEEVWVDLLSGRLRESEARALLSHKQGCPACRDALAQWEALLGGAPHHRPAMQPSPPDLAGARRRRLHRYAAAYAWARRLGVAARAAARRPAVAAVCGLCILLGAALLLLHPFAKGGLSAKDSLTAAGYARLHEPEAASVMSEPDTIIYASGPSPEGGAGFGASLPAGARETLWLNLRTHELFLLMEGLLPSNRTDVQAWARYGATNANLGLLRFHDSRAHLYASNIRPEQWEAVLLTIEPKGGSLTPSSPETLSIPLRTVE